MSKLHNKLTSLKAAFSLFWIIFQSFSNHVYSKPNLTATPDTIILGTIGGANFAWPGRFIFSFDQQRTMPPGDEMFIEYATNTIFCSNTPWQRYTDGNHKVNWYNDTINYRWKGHTNGLINSSVQYYGCCCGTGSSITFRIVYVSLTGSQAFASVSNLFCDLAPTQLESISTNFSSSSCQIPLNTSFDVLMHCPSCDGSSGYDMRYDVHFDDGKDTFIIVPVSNPGNFHLVINHTYDSFGIFNPEFHVYNLHGGGYDTLTVPVNHSPPASISTNGSATFCSGDSIILNTPFQPYRSYQWSKGGIDITGATSSSYTAKVGGAYRVTVTSNVTGCSRTTAPATILTKNPTPLPSITAQGPTTFCSGDSVVLNANSGSGLIYKWKKYGILINGATSLDYTVTSAGEYKVQEINSYGCKRTSGGVTVTVPCREAEDIDGNSNQIIIYPNPSSGIIRVVSYDENISQITITILSGQTILKKDYKNIFSSSLEIDLTDQSKGIYLIQVITDKEVYNQKIILE